MLGLILEKLGDTGSAKTQYQMAIALFDRTTYVEDDEVERSEHEDAVEDLARVTAESPLTLPGKFKLEQDLVLKRRSNWGVNPGTNPPRVRGAA